MMIARLIMFTLSNHSVKAGAEFNDPHDTITSEAVFT